MRHYLDITYCDIMSFDIMACDILLQCDIVYCDKVPPHLFYKSINNGEKGSTILATGVSVTNFIWLQE